MAVSAVLVVDDELDHGTTVRAILERGTASSVVVCATVEDALRQAAAQPFAVAIVDLRMPGRDGLSLMHALRRLQPALEVVILTAYPSPGSCRAALTEGAAAYLEKPFSPEALKALISALLAKTQAAEGNPTSRGGDPDAPA